MGVPPSALDGAGRAIVTGETTSNDFPTTPGASDTNWNGGSYDAFVVRLNTLPAAPSTTPPSSAGAAREAGSALALDTAGR